MVLSYACEAAIIWILEHKKESLIAPHGLFQNSNYSSTFNAITPLSTGGQPSQLVAMIQMGIEGGRATSILLMKFIIYQICVLFAYVSTIIFGFHMVITKFSGLALFILIGFILHVSSIIFLLAIMFAYRWTKSAANWLMNLLERFMNKNTVEKWRKNTMEKLKLLCRRSKFKTRKEKITWCKYFDYWTIAVLLFNSIFNSVSFKFNAFLVRSDTDEYHDYYVYGNCSNSRCVRWS